jgi:peptide/nickel transport system permease protein
VAKRVLGAIVVVVGVTFLAFALAYLSPTDPATQYFSNKGMVPTPAELAAKRAEMGLDRPFLEQYLSWIAGVLHGDLGVSYRSGRSVSDAIFSALPFTLALTATSILLTLAISLPLGLLCSYRPNGVLDNVVRAVTYLFNSLPTFFVALMLLYLLCIQLHWLPVTPKPNLQGIIMPTLAMAIPLSGWYVRQIRAIALEQLNQGYVEGLRARGISERRILAKHILRNIAVPTLTLVGLSVGSLLGGTAIVETIFGWPGVGGLSVSAINSRDYQVVQGYALVMAVVYLVVNALVDLSYRFIDPRTVSEADR